MIVISKMDEANSASEPPMEDTRHNLMAGLIRRYRVVHMHRLFDTAMSGIVAALVVAGIQYWQSNKETEVAGTLSKLQTRISTCLALASHHGLLAIKYPDEAPNDDYVLVDRDDRPVRNEFGEQKKVPISTNQERFAASIMMARELDMCMTLAPNYQRLKECVHNATYGQDTKQVYDDVTPNKDVLPIARENPAC